MAGCSKEMIKDITVITLSPKPIPYRQVPDNCTYLNYVSTFNTKMGFNAAVLNAIMEVQTTYFTVQDSDDPIPEYIPTPDNVGIVYGDTLWLEGDVINRRVNGPWSATKHDRQPFFIHKAVCRTEYVREIHKVADDLRFQFEFVYYYLLACIYGSHYDNKYSSLWIKKSTGLHLTYSNYLPILVKYTHQCRDKLLTKQ